MGMAYTEDGSCSTHRDVFTVPPLSACIISRGFYYSEVASWWSVSDRDLDDFHTSPMTRLFTGHIFNLYDLL